MVASREVMEAARAYAEYFNIVAVQSDKKPWGDDVTGKNWRRHFTLDELETRLRGPRCVAIGFLGGELNHNIVPLDFDTEAGEQWWLEQCEAAGLDPDDFPTVITPGKVKDGHRTPGRHRYVTDVRGTLGNAEGQLRPLGINVRGNGHAMLPPSPHPDGGFYEWGDHRTIYDYSDGVPACPAFVYDLIAKPKHEPASRSNGASTSDTRTRKYCMAAFDNAKQRLATEPHGSRNNALNDAAVGLAALAHHGVFNEDMARAALKAACTDNGLIGEDGYDAFLATFASGWKYGLTNPQELPEQEERYRPKKPDTPKPQNTEGMRGDALDNQTFEPLEWLIDGVLPIGATLIAGKAKIGKSWLVMDMGLAVASGTHAFGKIKAKKADVLYLALEDGPRRLHSRQRKLMGTATAPAGIEYFCVWPGIDDGLFAALETYLDTHPACRLVIVDTLGRVRGKPDGKNGAFQQDYSDISMFQKFAMARRIALLIVHHARKQGSDDVMDQVSGTTAVQAAVDTLMVLTRKRGQTAGQLTISGKDIEEEGEYALEFDKMTGRWNWLGEAAQVKKDTEQQKVFELLQASDDPLGPKFIADELEISIHTVKSALKRLKKNGSIDNPAKGLWAIAGRH